MLEKHLQNCSAMDLGSVNSLLSNLKLHDIFRLLDFFFKTSFKIFHVCLPLRFSMFVCLCETTFAYLAAAMFLFRIVPFHAFQTPIALPQKARNRSDDVKVFFIVIEINLFFSPWSFVDDGVEMFGRVDDDLIVVNNFLEFVNFRNATKTVLDTSLPI